jgi:hypothetical protein
MTNRSYWFENIPSTFSQRAWQDIIISRDHIDHIYTKQRIPLAGDVELDLRELSFPLYSDNYSSKIHTPWRLFLFQPQVVATISPLADT